MNAGSVKLVRNSVVQALLVVVALGWPLLPAVAQTPEAACAADTLYLISPEAPLDLRLESSGKPGLTISWPNLDPNDATCFTLKDTDNLNFNIDVGGGFGDSVDRLFLFSTPDQGVIGSSNSGNITITWRNEGPSNNGNIGGVFNLANNGGLWSYSETGASWNQVNNGLPMTWQRTNIMALDNGTGDFMVAAFTGGVALESESVGLFSYNGTNWTRLAADLFDAGHQITKIAVSALDNNSFAVGTKSGGMFVTTNGGEDFTQWTTNLDPTAPVLPQTYKVTGLNWESGRLLVSMPGWGVFISSNGGTAFNRSEFVIPIGNLDTAVRDSLPPIVSDFSVDPANNNRIVAALQFHGAFETTDGGVSWHDLYGDLVVADSLNAGAWVHSGLEILIDDQDPQIIVMGVSQKGLYRTADGGATWNLVGAGQQPTNTAQLGAYSLIRRQGLPGEMLVMEDKWKLLHSTDAGATWTDFARQPELNTGLVMVARRDNSGDFVIGSNSGGIYVAGSPLTLSETYSSTTSQWLRDLKLGLDITFDGGNVQANDEFRLVGQTFQGWCVWRSPSHDPDNMTLVGLFDRVNPEDCFEGYCGDNSLELVPQCYAAKRAACFDVSDPDTIRFFDEEVYNGFSYRYAVSSFDYGNRALLTPESNTKEMVFSRRWKGDELSIFPGDGNRTRIDVNRSATAAEQGEEIYVFPNPVRLGAGVPGGEGHMVVFTNLPEGSRVRVFTTAGDDIINLAPELQTEGQIYWETVNDSGEEISAGIYLYKVEMPAREDYWGRIVVIR